MVTEIRKNVLDFVKNGLSDAKEPLARVEKEVRELVAKVGSSAVAKEDIQKWLGELVVKVAQARKDFEKAMEDGVAKTFNALNIPTRHEVDDLVKQVNKLTNEVRKLAAAGIPAATKKAAVKTAKPAPKKFAKPAAKTAKSTSVKPKARTGAKR
ncbi:MAG: phasin family protein [Deltaproteobacteria bacterium]|nr:phasin family protein [Deltaproteobacteria bacterium]